MMYQYDVATYRKLTDNHGLAEELNRAAQHGWELLLLTPVADSTLTPGTTEFLLAVYRRPIPTAAGRAGQTTG